MFSLSWFLDGMDHKILKLLFFSFFTFLMLLSLNAISTARAALQWVLFVPSTPAPAAQARGKGWQGGDLGQRCLERDVQPHSLPLFRCKYLKPLGKKD